MARPATTRKQRLRKTKAQLIDEIEMLEQHAAAIEAGHGSGSLERAKASDRYLADSELLLLARFPSENPNPVLRVIPDGTVLYTNDAAIAIKGLLKGRKKSTLTHCLTNVLAKVSRTAEVQETEFESGDRLLAFSFVPVTDATYINIYGRDITERKRAEAELAEKEAQLHVALEYMPGGMVLCDQGGNYLFFNSQYIELHDYPDGLLKFGGSVFDETRFQAERGDYGPGDPEKLMVEVRLPFTSSELQSYERTLPGGRTLRFNIAPTPEGGFVTIATDITERKRAEQELVQKEAHLRAALDNMPGGMTLVDRNRNYVFFNSQYSRLFDFPDGQLKVGGSELDALRYQANRGDFGPGDPDKLIEEVVDIYRTGKPKSIERVIASSGRILQINVASTPDGGYVIIVTDISARKRAEDKLQAAHTRLGQFSEAVSEYLDPMLVGNLRDGGDLEPRVHFVTVFFADLVGSTRLSREMNEDSFGTMIQEFVGEMQRVIKAHQGYLEDISGDGIFGYIGNFDSRGSESDAGEAIVMALEMQLRLADLSNEFQSRYGLSEPLRMRIGISSGNALVGKTAGVRAIYTANGDIVNLGAKLEQKLRDLTNTGGILISEQTAALVEGHFALDHRIVTIEGQKMGAYMVDPAQSSTAVL
jgi:PAS domain-containing protein/class 3 adenylate cyclase